MSFKSSTSIQLQNLREQLNNLDKSMMDEAKKFKTDMSGLIDKGIIDQLNVDLPFNSTVGKAINDILLSKTTLSPGPPFDLPMQFDTAEYSIDSEEATKTGILPKQNDGNLLIIYNGELDDFFIVNFVMCTRFNGINA